MDAPPDPILEAALYTLERAILYTRICVCSHGPENAKQAFQYMDALHEIPGMLSHWSRHDIAELRLHLSSYPAARWTDNSIDLMRVFDAKLAELTEGAC